MYSCYIFIFNKRKCVLLFFEHIFIGISSALGVVLTIKNFLWPKVFYPLFGLDIVMYPDGTIAIITKKQLQNLF